MEEDKWIMHGLAENDPARLRSAAEVLEYINAVGFLPLFRNEIPGFSVEEHVSGEAWWTDDPVNDPWEWRKQLAASGKVAYGKLFNRKAGFVSKEWFPRFANYRRNGYNFDSLWEEGLASLRWKKIMDCFEKEPEVFAYRVRREAGFGKEGERNFEGCFTDLQMRCYLLLRDFRCRINKRGETYGWPISVYCTPESLWGYDYISSAYGEEPEEDKAIIYAHVQALFPCDDKSLATVLR